MLPPFKNEALADFTQPANESAMARALESVESAFGKQYGPVIGGQRYQTGDLSASRNPSNCSETVGSVCQANRELAELAVQEASRAFTSWKRVPVEQRARYLLSFAAELRRRKAEFCAWLVFEVGKSWAEADADVAEAIDFSEFYAREALRYAQPRESTAAHGEQNEVSYIPLGAGIVIPPWNFPLAITVGMTLAAVVTGNTVVLKPSSESPVVAAKFVELLEEISLPPGVVNFLPGSGGRIGDFLVSHPQTRFIAFTGSREVGLRINELAAKTSPGQIWLKRVVAEMGGKNAILVDETADLDAAVDGVINSAFGYSGQKCSACSRLIALDSIYDRLVERVAEAARRIPVGPVKERRNWMGPVASQNAYRTILNYIEIGKGEGRLIAGGGPLEPNQPGWFIQPTVIADVDPGARIAQEEIFGPVLATLRVKSFEEGLAVANNTDYGLTGAVYSRDRVRLEEARREFHAGNLYFNRKCTGALVGVHPFGGFNMSGTDSKAGGRDYLLLFLQAKVVSERL